MVIRPTIYKPQRLPDITTLFPLIFERSVHLRGWDFPQTNMRSSPHIDRNWVGFSSSYHQYFEHWRFYQSGQFIDYLGMTDDWRQERGRRGIPAEEDTGRYLPIDDTIMTFAEIFEFAARLALTDAYALDNLVHVEVTLYGLKDRHLYVDDPGKTRLYTTRKASLESFPYMIEVPREDLIADSRGFALEAVIQVFNRFGWQPGMVNLKPTIDKLRY